MSTVAKQSKKRDSRKNKGTGRIFVEADPIKPSPGPGSRSRNEFRFKTLCFFFSVYSFSFFSWVFKFKFEIEFTEQKLGLRKNKAKLANDASLENE